MRSDTFAVSLTTDMKGAKRTSGRTGPVAFRFDFEKAEAALVHLASHPQRVPNLDKYKVGKLLFLADKYHVVRYSRPILGDYYKALPFGPVPQTIIDVLQLVIDKEPKGEFAVRLAAAIELDRSFENPHLRAKPPVNIDALSKSDLEALDLIIARHGTKTFEELMALTHHMAAYRKVDLPRFRRHLG